MKWLCKIRHKWRVWEVDTKIEDGFCYYHYVRGCTRCGKTEDHNHIFEINCN